MKSKIELQCPEQLELRDISLTYFSMKLLLHPVEKMNLLRYVCTYVQCFKFIMQNLVIRMYARDLYIWYRIWQNVHREKLL